MDRVVPAEQPLQPIQGTSWWIHPGWAHLRGSFLLLLINCPTYSHLWTPFLAAYYRTLLSLSFLAFQHPELPKHIHTHTHHILPFLPPPQVFQLHRSSLHSTHHFLRRSRGSLGSIRPKRVDVEEWRDRDYLRDNCKSPHLKWLWLGQGLK